MMTNQLWRMWVCVAATVLIVGSTAWAKQVVVTLKDGRQITGDLVSESPDAVTVSIADINTTFPRSAIATVEDKPTLDSLYKQKLERLTKDDVAGRYQLAQWLYTQGSDEQAVRWSLDERKKADQLAIEQLDWLLRDDPDNVQVRMLKGLTAKRIEDRRVSERPTSPDQTDNGGSTAGDGTSGDSTYLTAEQRNLLKIYEIDLSSKPKLVIPASTVEKIYADERLRSDAAMAPYQGRSGKARFRTLQGYEQLEILFQLRARSLYDEVQVRSEPTPLREFRTKVNPTYVVGHCGRCHAVGKDAAPQFFTRKANGEEAAYTNFLILSRMTGGIRDMIDRQTPDDSLLFQYGLPREEATFPHPEVPNFRHYFSGKQDKRYQEMTEWVKTLYRPTPRYPIEYTAPGTKAPAAEPVEPQPAPAPLPAE